jgi:hypothetical protein
MSASYVNKDKADRTSRMHYLTLILGRARAQEVSCWLPTATAQVNNNVGESPHIIIMVLMRVNHFIYTMYNIYTI